MLYYGDEERDHRSSIRIVPTITDNRRNGSAWNKLMSTKYPASAIMMEMASNRKKKGIRASLEWAPRDGNREADSSANGNHEGFSDERRMHVQPRKPGRETGGAGSAGDRTRCVPGTRGEHREKSMIYISIGILVDLSCTAQSFLLFSFHCSLVLAVTPRQFSTRSASCALFPPSASVSVWMRSQLDLSVRSSELWRVDPQALSSSSLRESFDRTSVSHGVRGRRSGSGQFAVCLGPPWIVLVHFGIFWLTPMRRRGLASPTLRVVVPSLLCLVQSHRWVCANSLFLIRG